MNAREVLLTAPDVIRKTELDLWQHKEKREQLLLKMRLREADVALAVASAVDEAGKKRFTNDAQRDAETRRILATDQAFNDARREAEEEKGVVARVEAALEFHRARQRNARALALSASPLELVFEEAEP